ncbi:Eco57I restriction-modification methylase domain-containing protein [Microcoleus sp. Z1_C4]|uniref:Eco57I restriction-modification methylase domain-containing protein n=1 Tax=Microcoleus sp. Z1_C4 TaxID=3055432 RepID=UPI002FCE785B
MQLDDLRTIDSPEKIASMFRKLGYVAETQPLNIEDLQLSARNTEAITETYLIANQGNAALQVLLFQLEPNEWVSPSTASTRMKAIASQLGKRATEFLLLATKDYNQLMLVNPRKTFDEKMNVKASIRKLLIDRTNPTAYDRDRLEAIAAKNQTPLELYKTQCEAFDVEKLTKQFYRGYKELFDRVQAGVKKYNLHSYFNDSDRLHQFSQRLLGRIMFLYFLQKKEFLAGDRRFLTKQYEPFRTKPDDTNYYGEVLEPLFFETLNAQRPNFESRWGKIPYLNGGLFDRDYGAGIRDAAGRETPETITLPNSLFDPGSGESILGFFNNYNFTVSENVAGDEDVAVDPEMLGKVFENMLAAEERGQSGTFYTPRGIVHFMCAEVLTRYLVDESGMDCDAVRQFVEYDPDLSDTEFNQLMSPQQARSLKKAVENIKVLDPAVGSGAFPLGMMQTILQVRQAIARREGMTVQRGSLTISEWKRKIIGNNLYGVDIKPEALEIAKLRMWLSLVVDIPDIDDVEPLPNLDYKLMCGNSLISTIQGEQLIPEPNKNQQKVLNVTPVQAAIQPLIDLQYQYFEAHAEERKILRGKILEAEKNVFRVAIAYRRSFGLGKQKELENQITLMKGKVSKVQKKERQQIADKLGELEKLATEVEKGMRALNFFQWHLHFNEVFQHKGGFDIVIGNPPYGGKLSSEEKKLFKEIYSDVHVRTPDTFNYFISKSLGLFNPRGHLAFIVPNTLFFQNEYIKTRKILLTEKRFCLGINFGDGVFEAQVPSCIFIAQNQHLHETSDYIIKFADLRNIQLENVGNEFINQSKNYQALNIIKSPSFTIGINEISLQIITKIAANSNTFNDVAFDIARGIDTGANEVFLVTEETCKSNHIESNLIKKTLVGREVDSYYYKNPAYRLIYITKDIQIDKHCNTFKFLEKFKNKLLEKSEVKQEILPWWCLSRPRYPELFEGEKIILRQTSDSIRATLDWHNHFVLNNVIIIKLYPNSEIDYKFALAILNSKITNFVYRNITQEKGRNFAEVKPKNLRKLFIPKIDIVLQLDFISLVDKILSITQNGDVLSDSSRQIQVKRYKDQIDRSLYDLYNLTPDEINIIEAESV